MPLFYGGIFYGILLRTRELRLTSSQEIRRGPGKQGQRGRKLVAGGAGGRWRGSRVPSLPAAEEGSCPARRLPLPAGPWALLLPGQSLPLLSWCPPAACLGSLGSCPRGRGAGLPLGGWGPLQAWKSRLSRPPWARSDPLVLAPCCCSPAGGLVPPLGEAAGAWAPGRAWRWRLLRAGAWVLGAGCWAHGQPGFCV